jgi:hypothetical protein
MQTETKRYENIGRIVMYLAAGGFSPQDNPIVRLNNDDGSALTADAFLSELMAMSETTAAHIVQTRLPR